MLTCKPKVFILGISGFLGYNLAIRLREDFLIVGACLTNFVQIPGVQIFPLEIKHQDFLEPLVRIHDPDIIINAIGMSDRAEMQKNPKRAEALNMIMAVSMAALAAKIRAKFIQISCAEVYDGSDGNYQEEDTDYTMFDDIGRQKIAAESYIRTQTLESTIVRVGRVLGLGHPYRPSSFDKFRLEISRKNKIECSQTLIHSYLSVKSLASAIRLLASAEFPGKHRIFNLGGPRLSEFDLHQGWARLTEGTGNLVLPLAESEKRDISLKSDAFEAAFPKWKAETEESLYLNLLEELSPGTGTKKWQKILQTQ